MTFEFGSYLDVRFGIRPFQLRRAFRLHRAEKNGFANSVDLDETVNRLVRTCKLVDSSCKLGDSLHEVSSGSTRFAFFYFINTLFDILFSIFVGATPLIEIMDSFSFINGRVHVRNSWMSCCPIDVTFSF